MPNYKLAAERAARRHGVDPAVLVALINQESGFRKNVTSPAGARDIAQFMPATAKSYGVTLGDNRAADDLDGAARLLHDNLKRFGGDYRKALAAYNAGAGAVEKYGGVPPYPETRQYVRAIMAAARQQGGSSGDGGGRTTTTTRTVGGVDNRQARGAAIARFVQSSGKPDPVDLALSLQGLKDVPGRKVTTRETVRSRGNASERSSSKGLGPLRELFWQGTGGVNVKNGRKVQQGFVPGHADHVHVASGPKTVRELGRLAQSMGLHVGENPAFGGVSPVHVPTSYHYKDEAIDVSGDPRKMAHFAAVVAHKYRIKVRG